MLLRRQASSSTDAGPPDPTLQPPPASNGTPRAALEPWTIGIIVIVSLAFLGAVGTFFILSRTRRRGASTNRFENVQGELGIEPTNKRERRHSVVDDAKVHKNCLLKKPSSSRARPRSTSFPAAAAAPNKNGLDIGLGALRFGTGTEKSDAEKKKRRESQNGLDERLRSADDHSTDQYAYTSTGKPPFMRDDATTTTGSGAGSASALVSSSTPRRDGGGGDGEMRSGAGRAPPRRMDSDEQYWHYGEHSIAHTVRESFEDAEEGERQTSVAQQLRQQQLAAAVERLAAEGAGRLGHDRARLG